MGSSSLSRPRREYDFALDFLNLPIDAQLDVLGQTAAHGVRQLELTDVLLMSRNFIVAASDTRGLNRMLRRLSEHTRHDYPFLIAELP